MALPESIRYIPPPKSTDPTEIDLVVSGNSVTFAGMFYSASETPFSQGVELRSLSSLTNYTLLKARGNHSFITTLNGVTQDQNFFNDMLSQESLGITNSGSQVSLDTTGKISQIIDHRIEKRDLGQTSLFNDNSLFSDPDPFYSDPKIIIEQHPFDLVVPISLVQAAGSPSSMDGVIEPFDIRKIVDRSSIELPYVSHSVKGDMCPANERRESLIFDDKISLNDSKTRPFLDSQESFGNVDLPGAFSDNEPRVSPFSETTQRETFYQKSILDSEIRKVLLSGFTSGSQTYRASRVRGLKTDMVVSRHGFHFSQNDNYSYDSIAFGGLKK
jgi:hypothetical protein|tara:strand:+ start:3650 stop:4636 length:987 start_codon:yes stop_codon:yes gene_type:complete